MNQLNKIITELNEMQEVDDCIRKVISDKYFEDFKQELFLRLIEHPDGLIAAYKDGRHRFYTVRVIINLARRERDIFHKKYIKYESDEYKDTGEITDHYCEPTEFDMRKFKESEEERILRNIELIEQRTCTPYYRMMIEALRRHGTYREVSRQVGIPVMSVSNAFKKIRELIK